MSHTALSLCEHLDLYGSNPTELFSFLFLYLNLRMCFIPAVMGQLSFISELFVLKQVSRGGATLLIFHLNSDAYKGKGVLFLGNLQNMSLLQRMASILQLSLCFETETVAILWQKSLKQFLRIYIATCELKMSDVMVGSGHLKSDCLHKFT